jgi:hypothetical protein
MLQVLIGTIAILMTFSSCTTVESPADTATSASSGTTVMLSADQLENAGISPARPNGDRWAC